MAVEFSGAKAAVLIGERLLVTRRDDRPDIPWPGLWDFPGGGRDGDETPDQTLAREMREEVGLDPSGGRVLWRRPFPSVDQPGTITWFYVLQLPDEAEGRIVFGDEGQGWRLIAPRAFLKLPDAVPFLQRRFALWLATAH
ncbi:MAG: NUDIX hydrolase [Rubellimicrobium sp.]|nr:NUDIX hydrolase [Rubellimicrobium sp.]